ncbi:hypothetical protein BDP27DRAFT_1400685 [Rhodocollybia butyracea]|uniref:Uncharacterized protein n=1 Tax=Rhodocollybia butyracea TaxID=206335 RepID=A0A9P5Q298_9AGAR|nr:hypothetical protein BDP27DRAFT_1400685 [Rhodocollybia butyracea]
MSTSSTSGLTGQQPNSAPTGEQPNSAPAGQQPNSAPAGQQPNSAPAGQQPNSESGPPPSSTSQVSSSRSSSTTSTVSASTGIGTNEIPSPSPISTSQSTNSTSLTSNEAGPTIHSLSTAGIIGAVIGSLFVLVAGISILVYCRRRNSRRQQVGGSGHIFPLEQEMTHGYDKPDASDIDIIPNGIMSHTREKGHRTQTNTTPQAEAAAIPTSENLLLSLSGSPLLPTSTQSQDSSSQDDVRVQIGRMEATIGRMVEHMHRLESQLDWTADGQSDAPPPTYVSS